MYIVMDMKTRSYDMSSRAETKSATRDAIIRATVDIFTGGGLSAITLTAVADRAAVTVRTVLRHFGSREALIDAAWSQCYAEVLAERRPPTGDAESALGVLIAHYERRGDLAVAMSSAGDDDPQAHRIADSGRLAHRSWVEEVFAASLPAPQAKRSRLIDVLVVATDVYAWKLLRRDRGLSVDDVRDRMQLMTEAILGKPVTKRSQAHQEAK